MRSLSWLAQHAAALRALLVLTVITGLAYPLAITAVAQLPGLKDRANGSLLSAGGKTVGSALIGQSFTDKTGKPLPGYFQSRPSAAGAAGYDPTASGASNLGPESVVDTLATPADPSSGKQSLLTQVCARSLAIGQLEGVDGRRRYCTPDGVGAVLAVFRQNGLTGAVTRAVSLNQACPAAPFITGYQGVAVQCAKPGEDYSHALVTPIRGSAPGSPAVPADAVTASGSGLDPGISPAYAQLQLARVARERKVATAEVSKLIVDNTTERALGFMGEPTVNVLTLNLALDRRYPAGG